MRRRDFNNNQPDNYSGLTGYDEMSTRQVGEVPQPAGFGFAEMPASAQAQSQQPPVQAAPLFTPPPQNPLGLFGNAPVTPQNSANNYGSAPMQGNDRNSNNGFAQNYTADNNGYMQQQSFFGGNNAQGQNGSYAPQNNAYAPQTAERPMVFKIDREPNGYIYEYSDRLEYYRYTGAGMVLINSVKKR